MNEEPIESLLVSTSAKEPYSVVPSHWTRICGGVCRLDGQFTGWRPALDRRGAILGHNGLVRAGRRQTAHLLVSRWQLGQGKSLFCQTPNEGDAGANIVDAAVHGLVRVVVAEPTLYLERGQLYIKKKPHKLCPDP